MALRETISARKARERREQNDWAHAQRVAGVPEYLIRAENPAAADLQAAKDLAKDALAAVEDADLVRNGESIEAALGAVAKLWAALEKAKRVLEQNA